MKKRGRPILEDGRNVQFNIRMSYEELGKLTYMSDFYSMSKSEMIRKALENYYDFLIYRE